MSALPTPLATMAAPLLLSLARNDSAHHDETLNMTTLPLSSSRKRKDTAPPVDSSQRPCTRPRLSPPVSEPPLPSPAAPEPGSINATIREHYRTRLYVRPIVRTMNQLWLLGCQFVLCDGGSEPTMVEATTRQPQSHKFQQRLISYAKRLQQPSGQMAKKAAIEFLIWAYNISPAMTEYDVDSRVSFSIATNMPTRFHPNIPFFFNGRIVTHVQLDGLYLVDSTKGFFAFLHLDSVDARRQRHMSRKYKSHQGAPNTRLRDKKLCAIPPSDRAEDPYIVAALIALAQAQRRRRALPSAPAQSNGPESGKTSSSESPDLFKVRPSLLIIVNGPYVHWILTSCKVRLLLMTEICFRHLYLFEASFSSTFLDRLEKPSEFSSSDPIRISYYKLPQSGPEELVGRLPSVFRLNHGQGERINTK